MGGKSFGLNNKWLQFGFRDLTLSLLGADAGAMKWTEEHCRELCNDNSSIRKASGDV